MTLKHKTKKKQKKDKKDIKETKTKSRLEFRHTQLSFTIYIWSRTLGVLAQHKEGEIFKGHADR